MFSSRSLSNSRNAESSGDHSPMLASISRINFKSDLSRIESHEEFIKGYKLTRDFKSEKERITRKFQDSYEHIQHDNARLKEKLIQIREQALKLLRGSDEIEDYYEVMAKIMASAKEITDEDIKLSPKKESWKEISWENCKDQSFVIDHWINNKHRV